MDKAIELAERLQSAEYLEYIKLLQTAFEGKKKAVWDEGFVTMDKRHVTFPKYGIVSQELDALYAKTRLLYNNYKNNDQSVEIKSQLDMLLSEIDCLEFYKAIVGSPKYKHMFLNVAQIDERITDIDKQIEVIKKKDKKTALMLRKMVALMTEKHALNIEKTKQSGSIDFYIKTLPIIGESKLSAKKPTVKKTVTKKSDEEDDKPKTKKPVVKKTRKELDERAEKIKSAALENIINNSMLRHFNFRSKDECNSRETSKPYYISKENLIKTINTNPELAAEFPANYKKLKKGELCDIIFKDTKN